MEKAYLAIEPSVQGPDGFADQGCISLQVPTLLSS
jgi:hypothetical protein